MITCPYGEAQHKGMKHWIQCNKINGICMYQRYCFEKKQVIHTPDASVCKLRNSNEE